MENTEKDTPRVGQPRSDLGSGSTANTVESTKVDVTASDGIVRLNEATNSADTAYEFSTKKKWWILTVVALCQTSMSKFNPIPSHLHISFQSLI